MRVQRTMQAKIGLAFGATGSLWALSLTGCEWNPPLDQRAEEAGNVLAGELVVLRESEPANAFVLLYAAEDPPPPAGTGRPVNFAAIPAKAFSTNEAGLAAASWHLTGVEDGAWLIQALLDVDGDFHPGSSATGGATCGDLAGAHVGPSVESPGDLSPAPVTVAGGSLEGNLSVLVSTEVPLERPAFFVDPSTPTVARAGGVFRLMSTAVKSPVLNFPQVWDPGAPSVCAVAFPMIVALTSPTDGSAPEVDPINSWPKVYLEYQPETPLSEGERWLGQAFADPTAALVAGIVTPGSGEIGLVTELDLVFPGVVQHELPNGQVELVSEPNQIPAGNWSITVISPTGQTWSVPNELAAMGSTGAGWEPLGQAVGLVME